ncbi:hypothetical protein H181DRAFT_00485 [Streptomyces sp. WMMB 714]|jgi:hypothetical protein|nr:hypothetical protein H181DRAFT_00485 [Streptomyces sp. WMMB 714]
MFRLLPVCAYADGPSRPLTTAAVPALRPAVAA